MSDKDSIELLRAAVAEGNEIIARQARELMGLRNDCRHLQNKLQVFEHFRLVMKYSTEPTEPNKCDVWRGNMLVFQGVDVSSIAGLQEKIASLKKQSEEQASQDQKYVNSLVAQVETHEDKVASLEDSVRVRDNFLKLLKKEVITEFDRDPQPFKKSLGLSAVKIMLESVPGDDGE